MDSIALADYGLDTSCDAPEVPFRFEEGFGAMPEADASGARAVVDTVAPGAQKLDTAVGAWIALRAGRGSGEGHLDWKRGFVGG